MRSVEYKDLEVLAIVVQEGSIRGAAVRLAVSEPSVSRRLTRLEHALGAPLLERSTRGVVPTAAGRLLVPYIERGKDLLDEMFAAMSRSSSATRLAIWTDATLAPFVMVFTCEALAGLSVEISNRVASPETVLTAIVHGSADAAFSARVECPDSVVSVPFFADALSYVVHTSHPLASLSVVSVDDVVAHDVAVVEGPATDSVVAHLYGAGIGRDRLRTVAPAGCAAALARRCDHVCVSTRSSEPHHRHRGVRRMAGDLAEGGLVELPTTHLPSPEHEVHLLFRRSDAENPAIVALRSAVEAAWHRGTVFADSATR